MSKFEGMTCPWCGYTPKKGEEGFKVIKTFPFREHIERGHKCPKCNQSFKSQQTAKPEKFYQKENPKVLNEQG